MKMVFDLETDGLLDECTQIWCCGTGLTTKRAIARCSTDATLYLSFLDDATTLIGHNIINFDLPVLEKIYGWKHAVHVKIIDTWVLSKMLYPHRKSHSLASWGETLGFPKGDYDDWSKYTEEMGEYCKQDIIVSTRLYHHLMNKMNSL